MLVIALSVKLVHLSMEMDQENRLTSLDIRRWTDD